jgi:hypothetical protein
VPKKKVLFLEAGPTFFKVLSQVFSHLQKFTRFLLSKFSSFSWLIPSKKTLCGKMDPTIIIYIYIYIYIYILVKEKEIINGFMFQSRKKKSEKWVYEMDYNLSPLDLMID